MSYLWFYPELISSGNFALVSKLLFSDVFSDVNQFKKRSDSAEARIQIINFGNDFAGERDALMNIFFAAHKQNLVIDVANIGERYVDKSVGRLR